MNETEKKKKHHFDDSKWGTKKLRAGEVRQTGEVHKVNCNECGEPLAEIKFMDNGVWEDCIISCQNCDENGKESVVRIGMHADPLKE